MISNNNQGSGGGELSPPNTSSSNNNSNSSNSNNQQQDQPSESTQINFEKVLLLCSTCHNKVSQDVKELSEKVIPGFHDNKYSFSCKQCSTSKTPILFHLGKSWKCVIHTALFNLERITGNRFFHHTEVTSYVVKYSNVFLHDKSLADISKAVSMAFFNNKGYFISNGPYTGKWANPRPSDVESLDSEPSNIDSPIDDNNSSGNTGKKESSRHNDKIIIINNNNNNNNQDRSNHNNNNQNINNIYEDERETFRERSINHNDSKSSNRSLNNSGGGGGGTYNSRSNSRGRSTSRGMNKSSSRSNSRSRSYSRSSERSDSGHRYREDSISSSSRSSSPRSESGSDSEEAPADRSSVSCITCKNEFVLDNNVNRVLPGPFDKNYEFSCKYCLNSQNSVLKHTPKSWTKIIHTALHNLEIEKNSRFHSKKDIFQYISSHQKDLVSEPRQDASVAIINYILLSGRSLFINSITNPRLWCNRKRKDNVEFDSKGILVLSKEVLKKRSHSTMNDDDREPNQNSNHSHSSNSHSTHTSTSSSSHHQNTNSNNGTPSSNHVSNQPSTAKLTSLICNLCKIHYPNAASELIEDSNNNNNGKKLIIPSHIDTRYIYTCSKCSEKKTPILVHLPKSWKVIVHTTLYNLELNSGQKFSSNKALYSFISENANHLLLGGKTIDYLNKNLSGVLSSYKNLFCSSGRNMWGNVSQDDKRNYDEDDKNSDEDVKVTKKMKLTINNHQKETYNNNQNNVNNQNNNNNNNAMDTDDSDLSLNGSNKRKFNDSTTPPLYKDNNIITSQSNSFNNQSKSVSIKYKPKITSITSNSTIQQQSPGSSSTSPPNQLKIPSINQQQQQKNQSNNQNNSNTGGNNQIMKPISFDDDTDEIKVNIYDERIDKPVGFLNINVGIELKQLRKEIEDLEIPELKGLEFRFLLLKSPIALKQESLYSTKDCLYTLNNNNNITIGIRSTIPNNPLVGIVDAANPSSNPLFYLFSQLLTTHSNSSTPLQSSPMLLQLESHHHNNINNTPIKKHATLTTISSPPPKSSNTNNQNNQLKSSIDNQDDESNNQVAVKQQQQQEDQMETSKDNIEMQKIIELNGAEQTSIAN